MLCARSPPRRNSRWLAVCVAGGDDQRKRQIRRRDRDAATARARPGEERGRCFAIGAIGARSNGGWPEGVRFFRPGHEASRPGGLAGNEGLVGESAPEGGKRPSSGRLSGCASFGLFVNEALLVQPGDRLRYEARIGAV